MRALGRVWVMVLVLMAFSYTAKGAKEASGGPVKFRVTDLAGRQVEFRAVPKRIIALGPGALRLIVYMQVADLVVGVESMEKRFSSSRPYWIAHPELHGLPSVGPGGAGAINKMPDLESILRVRPDAIFITYMEKAKADILQKKLGIPVVVLTYGTIGAFDDTVFKSLAVIGKVLGKADRARAVKEYIEKARRDLKQRVEKVAEKNKPSVYAGCIGYKGTHGMDSTESGFTPFVWTGAKNVVQTKAAAGHLMVGKEQLLEWNPQVVFIDALGMELFKQDYAKNAAYYDGLAAFKSGRIYTLHPFNWYATNLGTVICDAYTVGKIIYPQVFSDVDLERKADEIYSFLLGRSVYGQMKNMYGPLGRAIIAPMEK